MKTLVRIIILGLFVVLSTSTQCDDGSVLFDIEFENRSNENVYITMMYQIGDSILTNEFFLKDDYIWGLNEISRYKIYKYRSGLTDNLRIQFNVYKHSTINNHTRQEMIDNEIYDKRYILSISDLQSLNFKVIYTGND